MFIHIYTRQHDFNKVLDLTEKEYFLNPKLSFHKYLKRQPLHIKLSGIVHFPNMVIDTIQLLKTQSNQHIFIIENDLEFDNLKDFTSFVETTLRKKTVVQVKGKTKRLFKKKQKEIEEVPPLDKDDIYKLEKLNELFSLIKENTMII